MYLGVPLVTWDAMIGDATVSAKSTFLKRVLKTRPHPLASDILTLLAKVDDLAPQRNLATHGQWNVDQPSGVVCARSRKKERVFKATDLDTLFVRMADVEGEAIGLAFAMVRAKFGNS